MSPVKYTGMSSSARSQLRPVTRFASTDLREIWPLLSREERLEGLKALPREEAGDFFRELNSRDQAEILIAFPFERRWIWLHRLAPDDLADIIQEVPQAEREGLLSLLDELTRKEVSALLAYAEDVAGGLMSPRYARVRPDMTVDEAFSYLRRQARENVEAVTFVYVLDADQHLLGRISFRDLFAAPNSSRVQDIMQTDLITVQEHMDQEGVSRLFSEHNLVAVPVVDEQRRMKGIVTVDDIVSVVEEEATEDIQKMGATETLNAPYLDVTFRQMVRKRASWLSVLFLGEMFTASAMGYFQSEIEQAVVLALFIPLIISSGGNSGSQATTLIIRAMALGHVRLRDWWRVISRETASGLALGTILGTIGFTRIVLWPAKKHLYGEHYLIIALTISCSLVGVVLWGTVAGSMLPFILRRLGFDPASASAPLVATLVDVTGLVIYFTVAKVILHGILL